MRRSILKSVLTDRTDALLYGACRGVLTTSANNPHMSNDALHVYHNLYSLNEFFISKSLHSLNLSAIFGEITSTSGGLQVRML